MKFILILFALTSVAFNAIAIPANGVFFYTGKWFELKTNCWKYGFFENSAIANGVFWKYQSIKQLSKNEYSVILRNESELLNLYIKKKDKNIISISKDKESAHLFSNKLSENVDFSSDLDSSYQIPLLKKGLFSIKGIIEGYVKDKFSQYGIISTSFLNFESQRLIKIDRSGRFEISMELNAPQEIFLEYEDHLYRLWGEPGKDIICSFKARRAFESKSQMIFGGSLGTLNIQLNFYEKKLKTHYPIEQIYTPGNNSRNVVNYCSKINFFFEQSDKFTDSILSANHFSKKSKQIIRINQCYKRIEFYHPNIETKGEDSVYLSKWGEDFIRPLSEIGEIGLLSIYYAKYITIKIRENSRVNERIQELTDSLFSRRVNSFSEIYTILKNGIFINEFSEQEKLEMDSLDSKKFDEFDSISKMKFQIIYEKHKKTIDDALISLTSVFMDSVITKAISLNCIGIVNKSHFSNLSNDIFILDQIRMWDQIRSNLAANLVPIIKTDMLKEIAISVSQNAIFHFDDPIAFATYKKYFDKFKGKVIYADFWGTYCTPCWREVEYMKKLREVLNTNDIVFVFFCIDDKKEVWLRDKEKFAANAEHIFLEGKDAVIFKSLFNISGVPHSIIINKYGKVVTGNAPRPAEINKIKKIILDL